METLRLEIFKNSELLLLLLLWFCLFGIITLTFSFISWPTKHKAMIKTSLPFVRPSKPRPAYTKKDGYFITLLTFSYALFAFWGLGSRFFPTTTWQPSIDQQEVIFIVEGQDHYDAIYGIYGEGDNNSNPTDYQVGFQGVEVLGSYDLNNWESLFTFGDTRIYQYEIHHGNWDYPYLKLISANHNQTITEFAVKRLGENEFLPLVIYEDAYADSKYPATLLIDEQDKLVIDNTYYHEGYFDEVYHPRNAWEIANGQYMYSSVHPLFGTSIMALFIRLFGFSPFVWRMPGVLFSTLMVPVFYLILKRLFNSSYISFFGTLFFCTDFMHYTTARIGTLEPFSVFFILLTYFFMLAYVQRSFYDTPKRYQLLYLGLCGITMGFSIATKWTGCYSAIGLAILLFTNWYHRYKEYKNAKLFIQKEDIHTFQKEECEDIIQTFPMTLLDHVLFCIVFFIVIPIVIYFISYMPTKVWRDGYSIKNVMDQIKYIYEYHVNLEATHPFQSIWLDWLIDAKPVLYYVKTDLKGYYHTISCMSHPLLVWLGLFTFPYTVYHWLKHKSMKAFFIVVGYLAAIVPWLMVDRCIFSYHFYPTSLFMIMSIVFFFHHLIKNNFNYRYLLIVYTCFVVLLFFAFLPVISGLGTSRAYVDLLKWFPGWYF